MTTPVGSLAVSATPLAGVSEEEWSALLEGNPSASAFSLRAFHQAWWSAHGGGAEDVSIAARSASNGELLGYLPLMRRPDGVIYSGATLHIDYATVLLAPHTSAQSQDPDVVADALAAALLALNSPINAMRVRPADDAHVRMVVAIQRAATVAARAATYAIEEPAPFIELQGIRTLDEHLDRLDKKQRHEIRRKVRRGEAAGVQISASEDLLADLPEFIRLHRARWGERGLFTETPKGVEEEAFLRELFARAPLDTITMLMARNEEFGTFAAGLFLRDAGALRYWNAGGDAAARALSPGVLLFVHGLTLAINEGRAQLDFLRGNEPYKYECGAVDAQVMKLEIPR
ncbi:MAG: GNAT family N-acetyltransferase [Chloroflexi bacterium]|jgi:CelD/BcsL family acetyltransferase involved in cellulose biosynthesis|nr:MAG: GNAT family N-acetyltransferase [Chloroflexota bacterium]